MRAVDLHTHSYKSDGSKSPSELVDMAAEIGLSAMALTDHDTTDGVEEAVTHAADLRAAGIENVPEIIPGVELSTDKWGCDIHVVGLYIDIHNAALQKSLTDFVFKREKRNELMCDRLRKMAGFDISYEKLTAAYPGAVLTRAHYATYLIDKGYVKDKKEAFSVYLGEDTPYFVPRDKITPVDAVHLILNAGGIPILAHPMLYKLTEAQLEALVCEMKNAGLVGIEAIYSTYTVEQERYVRRLAQKYDLLLSGGSDYHGDAKPDISLGTGFGKLFVPEELLDILKLRR
ncbi:MAG: PHP domain-containing protein [Lachnospiraceae bacterium]|nr:PHP domain-containing protein [Lachnospiraceae bacterium]